MFTAGVDAGSRAIKAVVFDTDANRVAATGIRDQGIAQAELAEELLGEILQENGIARDDVARCVATGYGRDMIAFANTTITEITCHARGVYHEHPAAKTVVDIGGQDSKLLRLDGNGTVRDFAMNDRCAAGTGRFMEVVAERLDVHLSELGSLAAAADKPAAISSMCVVFAETEIIGLLASGETPANIVAGVQTSIASRIASMAGRNVAEPVFFTGGVALVPGMDRVLENSLGHPVTVAEHPQFTGALGAALLATVKA
jgi:(R)-2-hydroxyacyl-CoA dehydratese activating ATPase